MAGTVALTEVTHRPLKKILFAWTSSAGGAADGVTTKAYSGVIERVVQIPDGGGTQPTNAYDVTVTDSDGTDVLSGLGADLSNAGITTKTGKDGLGAVVESTLTLGVTNAGNAKGGKTAIYLR